MNYKGIFSIGNVWGIFVRPYLSGFIAYQSASFINVSGILRAS